MTPFGNKNYKSIRPLDSVVVGYILWIKILEKLNHYAYCVLNFISVDLPMRR